MARTTTRGLLALAAGLALAACTGPAGPSPTSPSDAPTGSASPGQAADDATSSAGALGDAEVEAFAADLRRTLSLPPVPSFTVPTDLLTSAENQRISAELDVPAGLYQGIAVVDARCTDAGEAAPADQGGPAAGARHYDDGTVSVSVTGDGTGAYDAPGLHVAVLPDGSGVYEDATTRLSVASDGAGTYESGDVRYTVRADGSGSYDDGETRVWVDGAGAGGYEDEAMRVSLAADGEVFGDGPPELVEVVREVLAEGFPVFGPVPRIEAVAPSGVVCGTVVRLDANVLFDVDEATVRSEGEERVQQLAALLVALGSPSARVVGHTDGTGGEAYNLDLSERRAAAVRDLLVAGGVATSALEVVGLGESRPLRPETGPDGAVDPAAQQLNRRVEVVLLG